MQKTPAADSPVVFQPEPSEIRTRVNAVDVFFGDDTGTFIPEPGPEGGKRPFVVVQDGCPMMDIQALTGKARARYDFIRQLDGYDPVNWEESAHGRV